MKTILALLPAAGRIAIWAIMRGYKLDRVTHDGIVQMLDERRKIRQP